MLYQFFEFWDIVKNPIKKKQKKTLLWKYNVSK